MALCIQSETDWRESNLVTVPSPTDDRRKRILTALGAADGRQLIVDDETLSRYYQYLSANLRFPFTAYYPLPRRSLEQTVQRCVVRDVLDPARFVSDGFDGLCCTTRKGKYEVYLPLIDLELPQHSRNFQMIEDYWYWFSNWRQ